MNPLVILQAVGAANSAIGAYFGAKSQQSNLRYQAGIDRINARLSDLQAKDAIRLGQRQEQSSRLKTAQTKSTQRVNLAANGIDLGSDVSAQLQASTDLIGEVDANTIEANAIKSAWGYRIQSTNLQNQANIGESAASSINPWMSAATSLLGSATSASANWGGK